jgi:hypothetical protein
VPSAEALGQSAPLATVLGNIKDRIQDLQVRQANIAALSRQAMLDALILGFSEFHHRIVRSNQISVNTPLQVLLCHS